MTTQETTTDDASAGEGEDALQRQLSELTFHVCATDSTWFDLVGDHGYLQDLTMCQKCWREGVFKRKHPNELFYDDLGYRKFSLEIDGETPFRYALSFAGGRVQYIPYDKYFRVDCYYDGASGWWILETIEGYDGGLACRRNYIPVDRDDARGNTVKVFYGKLANAWPTIVGTGTKDDNADFARDAPPVKRRYYAKYATASTTTPTPTAADAVTQKRNTDLAHISDRMSHIRLVESRA